MSASYRTAQRLVVLGLFLLLLPVASAQQRSSEGNGELADRVRNFKRPHLTVVISIDQFRADYLRRFTDLFLPANSEGKVGGFRYLMTAGSYFLDARYGHFPLFTGPGHSIILTGAYPYKTGIISNNWWEKPSLQNIYCSDDLRHKVVGMVEGSQATPMGPKNLLSTTVGDELKMATAGASKVITISLKDRAAILLGGHAQDMSIWYDDYTGRWISSTAYCKDGKLPAWVEKVNTEALPEKALGTTWTPSVSPEALKRTMPVALPPEREPYHIGIHFPHKVGTEKNHNNLKAFTLMPAANRYVFATAERAILDEHLGQRGDQPDLLALNLSTNDYVGHTFGPYSPEMLDITVQTDKMLSDFLNFLKKTIPGGLREVVFVVTGDHGVVPIPETAREFGIEAGRISDSNLMKTVQDTLTKRFGAGAWLSLSKDGKKGGYIEPYLYLNDATIQQALESGKATSRPQVEEAAAEAIATLPGVYACYTHTQIMHGNLPPTDIARRVANGFYPRLSGDVLVVSEQMHFTDDEKPSVYTTTHGTPYSYDFHVPILISGPGIRPGVWADPVSPADIAPTLCALLGIAYPSGCEGVLLKPALR